MQEYRSQAPRSRSQTIVIVLVLTVLVFAGGYIAGERSALADGPHVLTTAFNRAFQQSSADPGLLATILDKIQSKYLQKPVDAQQLLYGAATGLVDGLDDPYSAFFPPEETKAFQEELSGTFEGIGVEIGVRNDEITVITPMTGSPAQNAGVLAGDIIAAVDGAPTVGMSLDEVVSGIRGEKGTQVILTLIRGEEAKDVTITRDTINVASVTWENIALPDDRGMIAAITLSSFTQETAQEFTTIVNEIRVANPGGILLDVRNNPGGFLDMAVDVAGHFIGKQPVVIERNGDGDEETFSSTQAQSFHDIPVVVLVNEGTASAAEILAGALQDAGAAVLIGSQTFGKGTVQEYEQLSNGASLKLTVAEWLTPGGRTIEKDGLTPDKLVDRTVEDYTQGKDPQRDAAVTYFVENLP